MNRSKCAALASVALAAAVPAEGGSTPAAPAPGEVIRWPGDGGRRIAVVVGITIIDFARIIPQDEVFEIAGYLDLSWTDPTLARPPGAPRGRRRFRVGDIWSPELEFVNAAGQVRSEREGDLYVDGEGRVRQRVRFSHKFRSALSLRRFPFDRQTLRIVLPPFDPIARDIDLAVEPASTGKLPGASAPNWAIEGVRARVVPPPTV